VEIVVDSEEIKMPSCIVTGCGNTSKKHLEGISFHAYGFKYILDINN
jgi:hypothetical protein